MIYKRISLAIFLILAATAVGYGVVFAEEESDVAVEDQGAVEQINALNDEVSAKRSEVDRLNANIAEYRKKIERAQLQSQSLANETDLLENRIAKSELDIQATEAEIAAVNAEVELLETRMAAISAQLDRDRESLAVILRKMDVYDNDMALQLLFGTDSFGELFDRLQELAAVTDDLQGALTRAEAERGQVEADRAEQIGKHAKLAELQVQQEKQKETIEGERQAKEMLLAQSERTEAQFQVFLETLKGEQQYVNREISVLQSEIEDKLAKVDTGEASGGSSVLSWPVPPLRGLSTTFRDPTYPFRRLFEHTAIDIPTPSGTPVKSAAPGYVAWTRTGSMYGNYVMVIHTNGIATLYAHLSKISVKQDEFVARGSTLGLSGGVPGTPGAGLSTGAHLHFEVREEGIPVNPMLYLVD